MKQTNFIFNDGGRADAGYKGQARDCVCRAISIVTGKPYKEVYKELSELNAKQGKSKTASHGIDVKTKHFKEYMTKLGFVWVPTMEFGKGCTVHLKADELPSGRIIVNLSKHFAAFIDGVLHDTHDSSRNGTRCVYGYYKFA